jgi:hypothetical protein
MTFNNRPLSSHQIISGSALYCHDCNESKLFWGNKTKFFTREHEGFTFYNVVLVLVLVLVLLVLLVVRG